MSKFIFLDVDGTLVDYHNHIPESAVKAIRQARENGHLIYVCTRIMGHWLGWDDGWQWLLWGASWPSHHSSVDIQGRCSKDCRLANRAPLGLLS